MAETSRFFQFVEKILKKPVEKLTIPDKWNLCRYYYLEYDDLFPNMAEKLIDILDQVMIGEMTKSKAVELYQLELGGLEEIIDSWKNVGESLKKK
ncbi:MAG: hypothetical protein ACFFCS_28515 [Candidatus Hodarchaeota archaeon]